MEKMDALWILSVIIIGVCTLVVFGSRALGITLPDSLIRTMGIMEYIAAPVMIFTSVKKLKK